MLRGLLIVWMVWGWLAGGAAAHGMRHAGAAEVRAVLQSTGAFSSPAGLLTADRPPSPSLAAANLTNDGVRSFVYDPENRLTSVFVPGAWRSDFGDDGLGRRRTETDFTWQGGWTQINQTRYLYDGLQIIQERDSNSVPRITYTRGLDFSGTLAGAGGIGGLLAMSQPSTNGWQHYHYHTDGSGNVTALFDGQATMQARYLYGPFGRLVAQWGPMAAVNSMQFSSMPTHAASGVSLYPFRAYAPGFQRWLTRDPIGEAGGLNVYDFVGNRPVGLVDPLGHNFFTRFADALVSPIASLMSGYAQFNGVVGLQNQLSASTDCVNPQDFQLQNPNYNGGPITAGNPQAVASAANIAAGATGLYLDAVQLIATGGIASQELALEEFGGTALAEGGETLGLEDTGAAFMESAAESGANAYGAIGSTGSLGEQWLAENLGGESQVYFGTTQGGRYVDQLAAGVANESKVGYQSLTPSIQRQISKDAELLNGGSVQSVNWHFFQSPVTGLGGPSQPLRNALQQNGITVIIH